MNFMDSKTIISANEVFMLLNCFNKIIALTRSAPNEKNFAFHVDFNFLGSLLLLDKFVLDSSH